MNKAILGFIAALLVGAGAFFLLNNQTPRSESQPQENTSVPEDTAKQPNAISYTDSGFSPATITVKAGSTVVFENQTAKPMWVASDPHPIHTGYSKFDQRSSGDSYSFTFTEPGTYPYHNHLSPQDRGTVVVE